MPQQPNRLPPDRAKLEAANLPPEGLPNQQPDLAINRLGQSIQSNEDVIKDLERTVERCTEALGLVEMSNKDVTRTLAKELSEFRDVLRLFIEVQIDLKNTIADELLPAIKLNTKAMLRWQEMFGASTPSSSVLPVT